jgi:hypothetical protein
MSIRLMPVSSRKVTVPVTKWPQVALLAVKTGV